MTVRSECFFACEAVRNFPVMALPFFWTIPISFPGKRKGHSAFHLSELEVCEESQAVALLKLVATLEFKTNRS